MLAPWLYVCCVLVSMDIESMNVLDKDFVGWYLGMENPVILTSFYSVR